MSLHSHKSSSTNTYMYLLAFPTIHVMWYSDNDLTFSKPPNFTEMLLTSTYFINVSKKHHEEVIQMHVLSFSNRRVSCQIPPNRRLSPRGDSSGLRKSKTTPKGSHHSLVKDQLRGHLTKLSQPRYFCTWEIDVVLKELGVWASNCENSSRGRMLAALA